MPTPTIRRRRYVKRVLLERTGYQFGQHPNFCKLVTARIPGDVACADTCIQTVYRLAFGRFISLDSVRRRTGAPAGKPNNEITTLRGLRALGLPYEKRESITAAQVLRIARERGPVLVAEAYWAHPQWKGYRYASQVQTGVTRNPAGRLVEVGFAQPLEAAGNNQPTFRLGHMVLVATSQRRRNGPDVGFVRDPNHASPGRPERPAWDKVTAAQLGRMLRSIRPANGGRVLAFVPTERIIDV